MTLISEIRALVADAAKPITLIAVPRWAALYLGRERAAELDTKLVQAHADALRHIPGKRQNNGACVMWLPVADHPFGGCFIFAHPAYEAGLLIAYSYREPILFPRRFSEQLREGIGGPLIPWRSDQDRWFNNPLVAEREMRNLTQECIRATRKNPLYIHPSPFLVQVINDHAQSGAVDAVPAEPKIVTRHIFPPIPDRSHDWHAYLDGHEESGPQGFGHTEEGAIADLKEQMEALCAESVAELKEAAAIQ